MQCEHPCDSRPSVLSYRFNEEWSATDGPFGRLVARRMRLIALSRS